MQDNYVNMLIHDNMQYIFVDMLLIYVNVKYYYVDMQIICQHAR